MNKTHQLTQALLGKTRRTNFILRSLGVGGILALTTISSLALAGDSDNVKRSLTQRLSGAATVATLHRWLGEGKASWYGFKFQGRKTATGEKFDMNDLTCAHRSLPLGSWVRVTNLRNHKTVVVRVNDRGPASGDRIIDLSYAAASLVGLNGVAKVKLESAAGPGIDPSWPLVAQLKMPPSLVTFTLPIQ